MLYTVLIGFIIIIYLDLDILRRQDRDLFERIFYLSHKVSVAVGLILLLILLFSAEPLELLPFFFMGFLTPIYLLRRHRFIIAFEQTETETLSEAPVGKGLPLISDAYGVIIKWFFGVIVATVVFKGLQELSPSPQTELGELLLTAIFSFTLLLILIYRVSGRISSKGFWINMGFCKENQSWGQVIVLPVLLGLFFAVLAAWIATTRNIQPVTPLGEVLNEATSAYFLVLFLFMALLVAPLVEEVIFRGYFFHVLREHKGESFAIIFIAIVFSFLHVGQYWGDWLAITMVTVLGFTLTILRAKTGTTLSSVITHYVYNGAVTILPIIMLYMSNPAYAKYQTQFFQLDTKVKEELLIESISKQPNLADAYNNLAWLYVEEDKEYDKALVYVEKAITFDPDNVAYLDTLASVLGKLERYEEALLVRGQLLEQELPEAMRQYQFEEIEKIEEKYTSEF